MTTDAYTVEPGERIPVDPPARPSAGGTGTGTPRTRRTTQRRPVRPGRVALGAGVVTLGVVSVGMLTNPLIAAAVAAGVPLTVAVRRARRTRRSGSGRRTTWSRTRTTSSRMPKMPKLGGGRSGGRSGGGLPKLGTGPKSRGGRGTGTGLKSTGTGPKTTGTGPKTRGRTTGTAAGPKATRGGSKATPGTGRATKATGSAATPRGRGAKGTGTGTSRSRMPGIGRGRGPATSGTGRGPRTGAGTGTGRGPRTGTTTTTGRQRRSSQGGTSRSRAPQIQGRIPRTRIGQHLKAKRQADQDKYLAWWSNRPAAMKKAARTAARRTGAATGNVGKTAAAGFKAGATPRSAARAAWNARKAGRTTRAQRARGLAVGALGATGAFLGRAGTNGAKRVHRRTTRPAARWVGRTTKKATSAAAAAAKRRFAKTKRAAAARGRAVWLATKQQARDDLTRIAARLARKPRTATQPTTVVTPPVPPVTPPPVRTQPVQPAPISTPASVGAGSTGGNHMARQFAPYNGAVDLSAALYKWTPGSGEGALFAFYDAMNGMGEAAAWLRYGWTNLFNGVRQDLGANLRKPHVQRQDDVIRAHRNAERVVKGVKGAFERVHARELERRRTSNAQVTNVLTTNGEHVNPYFQPWDYAQAYGGMLSNWRVGRQSGAIYIYGNALPGMRAASWLVANGWLNMAKNVTEDLAGGLDPVMAAAVTELYKFYSNAAGTLNELHANWLGVHREDMERAERDRRGVANVRSR